MFMSVLSEKTPVIFTEEKRAKKEKNHVFEQIVAIYIKTYIRCSIGWVEN